MQTPKQELKAFLIALNVEAAVAAAALQALHERPLDEWSDLLASNSEWQRFGTFEALLSDANAELYIDVRRARAIVELVLAYSSALSVPAGAELLVPLLEGTARKEYANVWYVQDDYEKAFENIELALSAFSDQPALEVERAAALLVYAQVQHERKFIVEALNAIRDAATIFETHYHYPRHEMALEICGQILMDQKEFTAAQEVYQSAYVAAERLNDDIAMLRLDNNLGLCAVYLNQLDEARYRLTKAFTGFEERGLYGAMQHTVLSLAREAIARKALEEALEALHNVYAEFLDREMPLAAAQVLIEIGDAVTGLTESPAYARDTCRRLAESLAADEGIPRNLLAAVEYIRTVTENPQDVSLLRKAFDKVRKFLQVLAGSPTTAFAA